MKNLIHEIHRRSLWQVLGIYLVGAWIGYEVIQGLTEGLGLPHWFPGLAVVLFIIGLPIVLATAFVQEGVGSREPRPAGDAGHDEPSRQSSTTSLLTWKNAIGGGILAFALWGVVAAGWLLLGRGDRSAEPLSVAEASILDLRSIAVLPFASVRTDEESQAFVMGVHDDLLTQLAKIDSLLVISRTSVMQYRDTEATIPEIADELGVATVLEGGVDRAGDRVRVNVQLIDARTDTHLWAETYDHELTAANVFAIRTDLAKNIAAALQTTLTPDVEERIAGRPTESLEAYDLYSRAHYLASKGSVRREDFVRAVELYGQAIDLDPDFAEAYAGLAAAHLSLNARGYVSEEQALSAAEAAARRAVELDDELAAAHLARGWYLATEVRLDETEREYKRAIELAPGDAVAHAAYSGLLLTLKRFDESVAEARRSIELDPLSTQHRRNLVAKLMFARRYREAITAAEALIEMEPENADAHYFKGVSLALSGDYEAGLADLRRAIELNPADPYYPAALAYIHAAAGQREEAIAILEASGTPGTPEIPLKEVAIVYGKLGELDLAFEYLDRALAEERSSLFYLDADPSAEALHSDPRWDDFLRELGSN